MVDHISAERRSWLMSRVRGKDTKPEMVVRRIAHALGYRFRLHRKDLPGRPDLTFPRLRKVVFVHGCFWHRHGCRKTTTPKSNVDFWLEKFRRNVERDAQAVEALRATGWNELVIWECETRDPDALAERLERFLRDERHVQSLEQAA